MRLRPIIVIATLVLLPLVVVLSACAALGTGPPTPFPTASGPLEKNPSIRGTVTRVSTPNQVITAIFVEGKQEADTTYDRASVRVTESTRVFVKQGGDYSETSVSALRVGQRVEAWFIGAILESDPIQAIAQEIVIVK